MIDMAWLAWLAVQVGALSHQAAAWMSDIDMHQVNAATAAAGRQAETGEEEEAAEAAGDSGAPSGGEPAAAAAAPVATAHAAGAVAVRAVAASGRADHAGMATAMMDAGTVLLTDEANALVNALMNVVENSRATVARLSHATQADGAEKEIRSEAGGVGSRCCIALGCSSEGREHGEASSEAPTRPVL